MKKKVSELSGTELDYWVAKAVAKTEGFAAAVVNYSGDWSHGGPIIERECISLYDPIEHGNKDFTEWGAAVLVRIVRRGQSLISECIEMDGKTPLIAAMRCFVASKLGQEVEIK